MQQKIRECEVGKAKGYEEGKSYPVLPTYLLCGGDPSNILSKELESKVEGADNKMSQCSSFTLSLSQETDSKAGTETNEEGPGDLANLDAPPGDPASSAFYINSMTINGSTLGSEQRVLRNYCLVFEKSIVWSVPPIRLPNRSIPVDLSPPVKGISAFPILPKHVFTS